MEGKLPDWSDRLGWRWALWELYSCLNHDEPAILTEEASESLDWLRPSLYRSFRERMGTMGEFVDLYTEKVGHPTAGMPHDSPVCV